MRWSIHSPQAVFGINASGSDCTGQSTTTSLWWLTRRIYDLLLMRLLDEQYLLTPFYGYRKMQPVLVQAGYQRFPAGMNHTRVRRLMQVIEIETIYAKTNTSKPAIGHRIYPYLLRG